MAVLDEISKHDNEGHLPSLAQKRVDGYKATLFVADTEIMIHCSNVSVPVIQKPRRRDCLSKGHSIEGLINLEMITPLRPRKNLSIKNCRKARFGLRWNKRFKNSRLAELLGR